MELTINKKKKKEISKRIIKNSKGLSLIRIVAISIFFLSIVLCCIHFAISVVSPTAYVVNVRDVPTKDYADIISNTVLFFVIGCFVSVMMMALLSNLSGKNVNEREDETLFMMDDMVRYVFRTKNHSAISSRIVISIPYSNITAIEYCDTTKKVLLHGNFPCRYVEGYGTAKAKEFDEVEFTEFTIHDYFVPGFYENICNRVDIK